MSKNITASAYEAAQIEIAEHTKAAMASLAKAQEISDRTGVSFYFSVDYGMGGTYKPAPVRSGEDWEQSTEWESSDIGWVSSSSNC